MNATIENLVWQIKVLEQAMKDAKPEFEAYIKDQSLPLSQRWQLWLDAPDSLKNTGGWFSDGRLEAFKLLGYGTDKYSRNEAIAYEGGLVWAERHQVINMVDILESILDCLTEKFEADLPDDFDWDDLDGWHKYSQEAGEFLDAYREELLQKNLLSYRFDW